MPDIKNQKIGQYILEDILGEGGFGVTYRAIDENNNPVAIKMLKLKGLVPAKAAKYEELFRKEAEFLSQCNHPSIVQVKDLFQEDAGCYMVMEYVDGIDLATLVEENGPLPESQALFYIYQIGEALNVIHQQGFLHRDIKPLNILIRKTSSDAVLIDFGFVEEFQDNEVEIHPEYGSRGFAPIEQYDLRSLRGAYTDVYGLAATLYALLTAKVPPSATSRDRKIFKDNTDPLVPPKTKNPQISDRVNEAILKGLELQPENRPQSVAEWLKLLGYILQDLRIRPPYPPNLGGVNPVAPRFGGLGGQNDVMCVSPILETNSQIPETTAINPWGSAVGIDYSQLQELLTSGKWQEADRETELLMLAICGKEPSGRLTAPDLKNFPCRDLRAIDQLWVESSNGRFGFSVQNQIWQEVENNYQTFSDRVGWRVGNSWLPYSELQFNATAAIGHLPTWGRRGRFWPFLASRVGECLL